MLSMQRHLTQALQSMNLTGTLCSQSKSEIPAFELEILAVYQVQFDLFIIQRVIATYSHAHINLLLDQILLYFVNMCRYLRDRLHFIDKRRVAVWGWSYGGYVSAKLLSTPNQDIFHCGISVAPVTSWRLYGNKR